ncbi:MAG: GGDEF domain-containing protein, partial [Spirochaetia bacterium]|nr:GGDEF domain-containing protein [Spirochaetia bacterium]
RVLVRLAALVRENLRRDDYFARIGGEEFAVILSDQNEATAMELAEKLRRAVESCDFGTPTPVTLSLGVAEMKAGEMEAGLMKRADRALYQAKESGRNRVMRLSPQLL